MLLVLGPAEQFTSKAQRFLFQLRVVGSFWNGALQRLDELGDSREVRAVVGHERGIAGILQSSFDRLIWHAVGFFPRGLGDAPVRIALSAIRDCDDSFQIRPAAHTVNNVMR